MKQTKTNIVEFPQCDNGECENFEKDTTKMKYIDNCFSSGCEAFCNLVDVGVDLPKKVEKNYWTIVFQYQHDDGSPTDLPPNLGDLVMVCMNMLFIKGFGINLDYGRAVKDLGGQVETDD